MKKTQKIFFMVGILVLLSTFPVFASGQGEMGLIKVGIVNLPER